MTLAKTLVGVAGAVALSVGAPAGPASAAENKLDYSVTIGGTTEYIFRGVSLTNEDPAFQANLEFTYNLFYFGVWGSNIDSDPYGPWEVDIFAGIRPETGPVSWDLGVIWYTYGSNNRAVSHDDLDYVEFKLGASVNPVEPLTLGVTGYVTPEQLPAIDETYTVEGSASYSLPQVGIFAPSISGLIGYSDLGIGGDYTYWNAGLGVDIENFFLDFRYWDTDIDDGTADERFVFSAGVNLP